MTSDSNKLKNLLIFLTIILFLVLSINIYALSKINKPKIVNESNNFSSGLQVYEDKKYEFSFKYPLDWHLYKKDKNIFLQKENNIQCSDNNNVDIFINIEDVSSEKTFDEDVNDYLSNLNSDTNFWKKEKSTINSSDIIKVTENCDSSSICGQPTWFVFHNNLLLIFNEGVNSKYSGILDQIISTIEFSPTPTNISDLTNTWEVYKNRNYGYSIKYPSSWSIKESKNYFDRDTLFINAPKEDPNGNRGEVYISIVKYPNEVKNSLVESEMNKAKDKVEIAGVAGLKLTHNGDPEYSTIDGKSIFLQKNSFIYAISSSIELSDPDVSNKKQTIDQIINSFRFI